MELLKKYGVPIPTGMVADNPQDAFKAAKALGDQKVVVKAQVLAGGRGKGVFSNGFKGGVQMAKNAEEAQEIASKMIGSKLITKQTGDAGRPCSKVFLVEPVEYVKEFYLAILLDRQSQGAVIVGSYRGGMDIEAVAKEDPSAIVKFPIPVGSDPEGLDLNSFLKDLRITKACKDQTRQLIVRLYKLFLEKDATLVEINPLVETKDGNMCCLDAKLGFDDNASFRQKAVFGLRDQSQEDPREVKASKFDLNYIGLDGNIGCLVNGAGLAMATMDIIKLHGGEPANFLDVGGSATTQHVSEAFAILASDPKVKAILVNIFGGIMRCDVVAEGIILGLRKHNVKIPVVVRLQGTNEDIAKKLMAESKLHVYSCDDLESAAQTVVKVSS